MSGLIDSITGRGSHSSGGSEGTNGSVTSGPNEPAANGEASDSTNTTDTSKSADMADGSNGIAGASKSPQVTASDGTGGGEGESSEVKNSEAGGADPASNSMSATAGSVTTKTTALTSSAAPRVLLVNDNAPNAFGVEDRARALAVQVELQTSALLVNLTKMETTDIGGEMIDGGYGLNNNPIVASLAAVAAAYFQNRVVTGNFDKVIAKPSSA